MSGHRLEGQYGNVTVTARLIYHLKTLKIHGGQRNYHSNRGILSNGRYVRPACWLRAASLPGSIFLLFRPATIFPSYELKSVPEAACVRARVHQEKCRTDRWMSYSGFAPRKDLHQERGFGWRVPSIHRWLILAFVIGPTFCLHYISSNRIVDLGDSDFLDEVLQANICAISSHREQRLCSPFGRFISLAGWRGERATRWSGRGRMK